MTSTAIMAAMRPNRMPNTVRTMPVVLEPDASVSVVS